VEISINPEFLQLELLLLGQTTNTKKAVKLKKILCSSWHCNCHGDENKQNLFTQQY
jgi:hypothetical protein